MNKISRPLLALIVFVVCANLGEQEKNKSVVGNDFPDVDVYGTIEDTSGNTFNNIHNIRIGRMYKSIPMFTVPPQKTDNPADSTTYKDLVELQSITVPDPNKSETYNGREYIGLDTVTRSGEKEHYIVEKSRTILCDMKRGDDLEKKEFKFNRIHSITIEGWKKKEEEEEKSPKSSSSEETKKTNIGAEPSTSPTKSEPEKKAKEEKTAEESSTSPQASGA